MKGTNELEQRPVHTIPASLIVTVDVIVDVIVDVTGDVSGEVEGLLLVLESKMPQRGLQ
jgi:hypothetical protein